jgi:hypothetical protein
VTAVRLVTPQGRCRLEDLPHLLYFAVPLEVARRGGIELRPQAIALTLIVDRRETTIQEVSLYAVSSSEGICFIRAPTGAVLGRVVRMNQKVSLTAALEQ